MSDDICNCFAICRSLLSIKYVLKDLSRYNFNTVVPMSNL